jgi:hypothetical protein
VKFVSEAILPEAGSFDTSAMTQGLPSLPAAFAWRGRRLVVGSALREWRSTKDDRGDTYLDRLWFEFCTPEGAVAVVYFDKHAKRRSERWRLYTLDETALGA